MGIFYHLIDSMLCSNIDSMLCSNIDSMLCSNTVYLKLADRVSGYEGF